MRRRPVLFLVVALAAITLFSSLASARPAAANTWAGVWNSDFGQLTLGASGSGSYTGYNPGTVSGTITGNVDKGTWNQPGNPTKTGTFEFTMGSDGHSFTGTWAYTGGGCGSSCGWGGTCLSGECLKNGAAPSPPSSSRSPTLSGIQGTKVEVQLGGGGWAPAADGLKLKPGDRIHTGWKSRVVVTIGGHSVALEPMTLFEIQQIGANGDITFLKLGEVKGSTANRSRGVGVRFNMNTPTTTASVRGTVFSVLYDGAATIVSVTQGSVNVKPNSGPAVTVTAGHEVASTASSVGPLLAIGKAGAPPGSVGPGKAVALLTAALAKSFAACKANAYSTVLKPSKNGWRAMLTIVGSKKGTAIWTISGLKIAPTNPLAKKIATGCR
jgi:hypothetical protein